MTSDVLDLVMAAVLSHESCVTRMYLDTKSHVTVGVGELVANHNEAVKFPFVVAPEDLAATSEQIIAEYDRVVEMGQPSAGPLRRAAYYFSENHPVLAIPYDVCVTRARNRMEAEFIPRLQQELANFDAMPTNAQIALCDMVWSLGSLIGYPKLRSALSDNNFVQAAAQCDRNGASPDRNYWTRRRFVLAAEFLSIPKLQA